MNKHTVVVKFSNTTLDHLSVSKVSLWCIRNGKSYPRFSSLCFEKVSFRIIFILQNLLVHGVRYLKQSLVTLQSFFLNFRSFERLFAPVLENASNTIVDQLDEQKVFLFIVSISVSMFVISREKQQKRYLSDVSMPVWKSVTENRDLAWVWSGCRPLQSWQWM